MARVIAMMESAGVYWQALFAKAAIGTTNLVRMDDPDIDANIDLATKTIDAGTRDQIFQKIWDRLNALHPWVYLSIPSELYGAQKELLGVDDLYDGKINYLGNLKRQR